MILLTLACTGSEPAAVDPDQVLSAAPLGAITAPDFALEDVNETSPTAGELLGPEDQRERISAWYFGHAS